MSYPLDSSTSSILLAISYMTEFDKTLCMGPIRDLLSRHLIIASGVAGADAEYCEGGFFLLCAQSAKILRRPRPLCVGHAPFQSRSVLLNCAATRKTTKEPVSFLIVAVVNKAKTPKIM